MPSIKVLKQNGELVEEFELTERYKGSWLADDAMIKACECEGDIIEFPIEGCIMMTGINLGSKAITSAGTSYEFGGEVFNIETAKKTLLSQAIEGLTPLNRITPEDLKWKFQGNE